MTCTSISVNGGLISLDEWSAHAKYTKTLPDNQAGTSKYEQIVKELGGKKSCPVPLDFSVTVL